MLRTLVAVLVGALAVAMAAATIAVASEPSPVVSALDATRTGSDTLTLAVVGERRVGSALVFGAYGEAIVGADGADGSWELRVEDDHGGGDAAVHLRDDRWTVRSSLLDDVVAPGTWATVRQGQATTTPAAALAMGLVGELPVGTELLDVVVHHEGRWRRDTDEVLADGTTAEGWRASLDPDVLLEALPPAQAQRWRLQLLAVTPPAPPVAASGPLAARVLATARHVVAEPPPEVLLRAHVHAGELRRVELVVRGDGGGIYLQRRHVLEVVDAGRRVPDLPADAVVRDLSGSSQA